MKFFEKNELKILWPFYAEILFGTALWLLTPFFIVYFISIGLSLFQIGILMAIWPLSALIFEIPTGAIADIYGRKFSVIYGWILEGVIIMLFLVSTSYWYLIFLMVMLGLTQTLISGAYDAWTVDLLKNKKRKDLLKSYFTKKQSFFNIAFIFSGLIGAFFVAYFGLRSVFIVSSISLFISSFFLLFGEEIHIRKKFNLSKSFKEAFSQSKKAIHFSYRHHVLFYLLFTSFLMYFALSFQTFVTWTPLLKGFDIPDYAFGYLWSLASVFGIFTPFIASKLLKTKKERNLLVFAAILLFIQAILVFYAQNIFILIFLFMFLYGILDFNSPIFSLFFHKHIPQKMRATIGSVEGMVISLAGIIAFPIVGFLVDSVGARTTILISGFLMIPIVLLYLRIKK
jgi:MFS family permease